MRVCVFVCNVTPLQDSAAFVRVLGLVPPWRQSKALRVRPLPDKARSLGASWLVGQALRECGTGWEAVYCAANGKPCLDGGSISWSHSGDVAAVALCLPEAPLPAAPPLGLDVERQERQVLPQVVRRVATEEERALLESLAWPARRDAFLTLWTRKESCLKATGQGLSVDLTRLSVMPLEKAEARCRWDEREWLLHTHALPGHCLSLCVQDVPGLRLPTAPQWRGLPL